MLLCYGTNVNHELVKDGWCWGFRKYAPENIELEKLEKEARDDKKGLWADPAPVPPWVYWKAKRGQSLDLSDLVPLELEQLTQNVSMEGAYHSLTGLRKRRRFERWLRSSSVKGQRRGQWANACSVLICLHSVSF